MLRKFLKPISLPASAAAGILLLRVGVGILMLLHGYAKLQRALSGDLGFADPIGLGEEASLYLTIFAEFFCSLLLILGLITRLALIPLLITMAVVFLIVHGDDPFGDREHPLMFFISYLTLLATGPGRYSLDQRLF